MEKRIFWGLVFLTGFWLLVSACPVFFGGICLAIEEVSFRVKGMHPELAGIVEDEYTDMLDMPCDLLSIEGLRIYTNLSNLTGGTERQLSEVSAEDLFLLGAAGDFWQFGKIASIGSGRSLINPQTIKVNPAGSTGLQTTGSQSGEYSFVDEDKDNAKKEEESGKAEKKNISPSLSFLYALPISEDFKMGLRFDYLAELVSPVNNYSYRENLDTVNNDEIGEISLKRSGKGDRTTDDFSRNVFLLVPALTYQMGPKLTIGTRIPLLLTYAQLTDEYTYKKDYTKLYQQTQWVGAGGAATQNYKYEETHESSLKPNGIGIGFGMEVAWELGENSVLKTEFDYQNIPLSGKGKESTIKETKNDGTGGTSKIESTQEMKIDNEANNLLFAVGMENRIGEKFLLASALKCGYESKKNVFEATNGEQLTDSVKSYLDDVKITDESGIIKIILPVGLEYTITEWLDLRLGACHTIKIEQAKTTTKTISYNAKHQESDVEEVVTPQKRTVTGTTDFAYGLGLRFGDNLSLDLLSFSNLTRLDQWRLSLTLRF